MKRRCFNTNTKDYAGYGGRGITVCSRWRDDFGAFYVDMGPRPSASHSIDRIDNAADYSPENCRWVTGTVQAHNSSKVKCLTYAGETLPMSEWARRTGIKAATIYARARAGWSAERIIGTPTQ